MKNHKKNMWSKKKKIKTEIATHKVPKRKCFVSLILFVFNRTIIVIITDLGMPNIMNWDFPKRWDHRFFDKKSPGSGTLKHLNFICLNSLPTLRRTLRKRLCLAKFKSTRTRSFATPSLSCRESIYLNFYSTCSTKLRFLIRSVWCWNNFFFGGH